MGCVVLLPSEGRAKMITYHFCHFFVIKTVLPFPPSRESHTAVREHEQLNPCSDAVWQEGECVIYKKAYNEQELILLQVLSVGWPDDRLVRTVLGLASPKDIENWIKIDGIQG